MDPKIVTNTAYASIKERVTKSIDFWKTNTAGANATIISVPTNQPATKTK